MKIANQLFDRSSLNPNKKDAKLTVDKQATTGTTTSIPKKVINLIVLQIHPMKFRKICSFKEK